MNHCCKTEPCVDDVYCNCNCEECMKTDCYRPGCTCKKSHDQRNKTEVMIANWQADMRNK